MAAVLVAVTFSPIGAGAATPAPPEPEPDAVDETAEPAPAPGTLPAPPPDSDGDGLSDADERSGALNRWPSGLAGLSVAGDPTGPQDADSDDDGLTDGQEVGSLADDRMGLGTDPNRADTDGDGIPDGQELTAGLDPRASDTDRDGLADGEEWQPGAGQAVDAVVADRDHDFLPDGVEVAIGTDPDRARATASIGDDVFVDLEPRSPLFFAAGWALEQGVLRPERLFRPGRVVPRWRIAQQLERYARALGLVTTGPGASYTDIGRLSRPQQQAVRWAGGAGILPGTGPSTFSPARTTTRAQAALALFRFAGWAGAEPVGQTDGFADTGGLSPPVRRAIGWLQAEGIVQGRTFAPTGSLRRGSLALWLYDVDGSVGADDEDTDGDGLSDQAEVLGSRNPYPAFVDAIAAGGDGDGLSGREEELLPGLSPGDADSDADGTPDGADEYDNVGPGGDGPEDDDDEAERLVATGPCPARVAGSVEDGVLVPRPLPVEISGAGGPTDPDEADTDGDGVADGIEIVGQTDPNDADTDNDCLTDGAEAAGWNLDVDDDGQSCPGGGGGGCPDVTRYPGFSDPLVADTDGDGLFDHEERLLRFDAELADTDLDGLTDFDEWNRWFTSAVSVDSDQDSRGGDPDSGLPTNQSMFDGVELRDIGTSPSLADTDGDGAYDSDEMDSGTRDPLIAELPQLDMTLSGGTTVLLRKEREEADGGSLEIGFVDSSESTVATSQSTEITEHVGLTIGQEYSLAFTASAQPEATITATASFGFEFGLDTTRTFSREESATIAREDSQLTTTDWSDVTSIASGEISQGMVFTNNGVFTVELSGVSYALRLLDPATQSYDVVGTMEVPFDGITLAPGESTPPVQVTAEDVNVELVEEFLSSPTGIVFDAQSVEFLDSEDRNFDFVTEQTFGQTAQVTIDFGDDVVEQRNVSTNVNRLAPDDPDYVGLQDFPGVGVGAGAQTEAPGLLGVMEQMGYTLCPNDEPDEGCYTVGPDPRSAAADPPVILTSVDGRANVEANDPGGAGCGARWLSVGSPGVGARDFEDTVLQAGDELRLVFRSDRDCDEVADGAEATLGACVEAGVDEPEGQDCDGDGLTDRQEIDGWLLGNFTDPDHPTETCPFEDPNPPATGPRPPARYATPACPWVHSNPSLVDSDGDLVDDALERFGTICGGNAFCRSADEGGNPLALDVRTNPLSHDTDGDLLPDTCTDHDGPLPACDFVGGDAAPLHSAVRYVDGSDGSPPPCTSRGCWAVTRPDHVHDDIDEALDAIGTANDPGADPRGEVRSIWVARGRYTGPYTMIGGVSLYGGFDGDERRLSERPANPLAAPTVLTRADRDGFVVTAAPDTVLDGFRVVGGGGGIAGGLAAGDTDDADDVTLRNLLVDNNEWGAAPPPDAAGGIAWQGSDGLELERVIVTSNIGPVGGVRLVGAHGVAITNSTIANNASLGSMNADTCSGAVYDVNSPQTRLCRGGGGLAVDASEVRLERVQVIDNTALVGGGIDVYGDHGGAALDAELRVVSSVVRGNEAVGDRRIVGRGGGIHAHGSAQVLLSNCLVADNDAIVGPRWQADPAADGFGGGLFAHDNADVRVINCTFSGNRGAGAIVVGDEQADFGPDTPDPDQPAFSSLASASVGATANIRNSLFYGNTMTWQPTFLRRHTNDAARYAALFRVGNGLLGSSTVTNARCLGDRTDVGGPQNCDYFWLAGVSWSSSTELRSDFGTLGSGRGVRATNTLIGDGSQHASFSDLGEEDCQLDHYGVDAPPGSPVVGVNRAFVECVQGEAIGPSVSTDNLYYGLQGQGYVGTAVGRVAPPASGANTSAFYELPSYLPRDPSVIDRGNAFVDWDPFLAGVQDAPEFDLRFKRRVIGTQIDLGAYEVTS